jgi:hypothetical protein
MMIEKAKVLGEILGQGLRAKEDFMNDTRRRPLALELRREQVGLSVMHHFSLGSCILSGWWSWASLGVVLFESNLS